MVVLAGVALGLAFNVKLLEALIAAPPWVSCTCSPDRARPRGSSRIWGWAAAALAGVGLAWAIPASLLPGKHPWPVGSTDGSVWNAMFVFNGFGKVSSGASTKPGGPGPFRLIVSTGWHYDMLFGCVLVAAVVIGIAAGLSVWQRRRSIETLAPRGLAWAFAVSIAVWIGFAVLVFDVMQTVHARYLEALAPALAIAIGYGDRDAGRSGIPARAFDRGHLRRAGVDLRLYVPLQASGAGLERRCPDAGGRGSGPDHGLGGRAGAPGRWLLAGTDPRGRAGVPRARNACRWCGPTPTTRWASPRCRPRAQRRSRAISPQGPPGSATRWRSTSRWPWRRC